MHFSCGIFMHTLCMVDENLELGMYEAQTPVSELRLV